MANPYSTVSITGYNSNPPPDDGSQSSNNEVSWAKHKDKLADPLKTAIESIDANVESAFADRMFNTVLSKSSNYTIASSDRGALVSVTASATITLPDASAVGDGWAVTIYNASSADVTIDGASTQTINGELTLVLRGGAWAIITSDGANWQGPTEVKLTGEIRMYGGSSAPSGWLFCNGQEVSRATYSDLFDVIGETFGAGDGSSTFAVPDLRDRSPLGTNSMGSSDASRVDNYSTDLGDSGGEDEHQLSESEMPSHNHGGGNHDHTLNTESGSGGFNGQLSQGTNNTLEETSSPVQNSGNIINTDGGDNPHNTMHPFLAVNFIIRY